MLVMGQFPRAKSFPQKDWRHMYSSMSHTRMFWRGRETLQGALGGPWGDSGYLRLWGMRKAFSSWRKHFPHHLLHRRQWYHRDAILCSDEETEVHPAPHDPEPSPKASTLLERLPLSGEDED